MKKQNQLGMNPSTASGRLVKDILYSLVVQTEQNKCFQCGQPMARETFSIEHKEPWLDSESPVDKFFDLGNISFSHKSCNYEARRVAPALCGGMAKYRKGCRCAACTAAGKAFYVRHAAAYCPTRRREQYERSKK